MNPLPGNPGPLGNLVPCAVVLEPSRPAPGGALALLHSRLLSLAWRRSSSRYSVVDLRAPRPVCNCTVLRLMGERQLARALEACDGQAPKARSF